LIELCVLKTENGHDVMGGGGKVGSTGTVLWYLSSFSPPQVATLARSDLTHDHVMVMHHTSVEGVEDMASLGDLHEAAILYNIQQRYSKDIIYVSLTQKDPTQV